MTIPEWVRRRAAVWRPALRYGVPAWMVDKVAERRAAGDWRGACAWAAVAVDLDLTAIRHEYGADLADRVENDLQRLAPDLVRWHAPRSASTTGGLASGLIVLADYARDGGEDGPWLLIRLPEWDGDPQWLHLTFGRPDWGYFGRYHYRNVWWDHARWLWDADASGALLWRAGGGDRLPFHTRDGRRLRDEELPGDQPPDRHDDPVGWTEWMMTRGETDDWAEACEAADIVVDRDDLWRPSPVGSRVRLLPYGARVSALRRAVDREGAANWRAAFLGDRRTNADELPVLTAEPGGTARLAWGREAERSLPVESFEYCRDLELLRAGLLTRGGLHPMVRAAFFPDAPDEDYVPHEPVDVTPGTVRCLGEWHELRWHDGTLVSTAEHDPDQVARERTLSALGVAPRGCDAVRAAWRSSGWLPKRLRAVRIHGVTLARHGDVPGLEALLDAGVDPAGLLDRHHRNLLFFAASLNRPPFVQRLIDAGLDVNALDAIQLTPLLKALHDHASVSTLRALFEAGADPKRGDSQAFDRYAKRYGTSIDFLREARGNATTGGNQ